MHKQEVVAAVAEQAGLDKNQADAALKAFTDVVRDALASGDKVQIPGFGTFEARPRAARTGRNPQTGESIEIAASVAPAFKPAAALKEALNR